MRVRHDRAAIAGCSQDEFIIVAIPADSSQFSTTTQTILSLSIIYIIYLFWVHRNKSDASPACVNRIAMFRIYAVRFGHNRNYNYNGPGRRVWIYIFRLNCRRRFRNWNLSIYILPLFKLTHRTNYNYSGSQRLNIEIEIAGDIVATAESDGDTRRES